MFPALLLQYKQKQYMTIAESLALEGIVKDQECQRSLLVENQATEVKETTEVLRSDYHQSIESLNLMIDKRIIGKDQSIESLNLMIDKGIIGRDQSERSLDALHPVSYTHLTLPTICSV